MSDFLPAGSPPKLATRPCATPTRSTGSRPTTTQPIPSRFRATYHTALGALLLQAALWSGCASFTPAPPQAAPEPAGVKRVALPPLEQLVEYRPLRRDDFQATAPPRGRGQNQAHVAASTCAYLIFDPAVRFRATRRKGETEFLAEVSDLRFEARMDPSCSWWDKANRFRPDDYVLEHEQIHFDLVEIEARRLNQEIEALAERIRSSGSSSEEALLEIQRKFRAEFDQAVARVAERSREFDEETSLGFEPRAQAQWAQRVQSELQQLSSIDSDQIDSD